MDMTIRINNTLTQEEIDFLLADIRPNKEDNTITSSIEQEDGQ